jgi:hypothetical protein
MPGNIAMTYMATPSGTICQTTTTIYRTFTELPLDIVKKTYYQHWKAQFLKKKNEKRGNTREPYRKDHKKAKNGGPPPLGTHLQKRNVPKNSVPVKTFLQNYPQILK